MGRETKNNSFHIWIEDIWEEIEVQIYGIIGAIIFFCVIYLTFQPTWMTPVFDLFRKLNYLYSNF